MVDFPDIPASITMRARAELIASLGFRDINDLLLLEFRPDGVYAELIARNAAGRAMLDALSGDMLAHKIYIPIQD